MVAQELCRELTPNSERIIVAGSLRRRKTEVGDVEILFVPKMGKIADLLDLLGHPMVVNFAEAAIESLLLSGVLEKRRNANGVTAWGKANKLAVHQPSGIPVDLFTATLANWWNYLVCRTGGAENNVAICQGAIDRGWKWNPYGDGFSRGVDREETRAMQDRKSVV